MNDTIKTLLIWGAILFVLMSAFRNLAPQQPASALEYSAFIQEVQQQRVASVVIDGQKINGAMKDGTAFQTVRPNVLDTHLMDDLLSNNVRVEGREPEQPGLLQQLFLLCCPSC
ncbi:MAG: ATP-dependent metallopeptidase FtsH/Yme1/Tma family protein [Cellvibrionales bacterium]|nr:ATP-dependent metallopeptidase FtsH/Yme1/Tma family protein [Cellvibrionales bacterium]